MKLKNQFTRIAKIFHLYNNGCEIQHVVAESTATYRPSTNHAGQWTSIKLRHGRSVQSRAPVLFNVKRGTSRQRPALANRSTVLSLTGQGHWSVKVHCKLLEAWRTVCTKQCVLFLVP